MKKLIPILCAVLLGSLYSNARSLNTPSLGEAPLFYPFDRCVQDSTKRVYREHRHMSSNGFSSIELIYKGNIALDDTESKILSISPNGYMKFSKKSFGNKRSIIVESNAKGQLSYEYYVGRSEEPFEGDGEKWLASVLPEIVRMSGIGAEARVKRIYTKNGAEGVLDEIERISSNSVKGIYMEALLAMPTLSNKNLVAIALQIGEDISSSSERGRLYRKYSHRFLQDEKVAQAFFTGVSRISSSSEQGSVLRKVLSTEALTPYMLEELLVAAGKISSSAELGSVLAHVNRVFEQDSRVIETYFATLDQISSSSERGRVLRDLLNDSPLNDPSLIQLLESVRRISSSSEQGSVLRKASQQITSQRSPQVFEAYFRAIDAISSSSEQGSTLRALLKETTLPPSMLPYISRSIGNISSSSEQGSVLRSLISNTPSGQALPEVFFEVVRNISSSSEQGSVLRAAAQKDGVSVNELQQILGVVRYISSSSTQGEVMISVARVMPDNAMLREAYREAARNISSDSEYRRVMSALD